MEMIALDTNVIVRFLTYDDPKQAEKAKALMEQNKVLITKTVLLETEWVLRYSYELNRTIVAKAFEKLLGLTEVWVDDLTGIAQALTWYQEGFDFADALHLASSEAAQQFATFDKAMTKKAHQLDITKVVAL